MYVLIRMRAFCFKLRHDKMMLVFENERENYLQKTRVCALIVVTSVREIIQ